MSALGNKHECIECGAKFYDLDRSPAVCPSCGTDQAAPSQAEEEPLVGEEPAAE